MSQRLDQLAARVEARLSGKLTRRNSLPTDLSYEVAAADLVAVATTLRDDADLRFEILIDVAGVDYLDYGRTEWRTYSATSSGFGRGVNRAGNAERMTDRVSRCCTSCCRFPITSG